MTTIGSLFTGVRRSGYDGVVPQQGAAAIYQLTEFALKEAA